MRLYVKRRRKPCRQYLTLTEFVATNTINMSPRYSPFSLQCGDHPLVLAILMHNGGMSRKIQAIQTMVYRMKTALKEALGNLNGAAKCNGSFVDLQHKVVFGALCFQIWKICETWQKAYGEGKAHQRVKLLGKL